MGKPNGKAAMFALSLRKEMVAHGLSVRALGRLSDPADYERGRRRVQRHLSGRYMPSVASRLAYAIALDLPRDHFLDVGDEEESRVAILDAFLRSRIRQIVKEQVRA